MAETDPAAPAQGALRHGAGSLAAPPPRMGGRRPRGRRRAHAGREDAGTALVRSRTALGGGPRTCPPAPRRPRMRGGRRRHAGAASGTNAGHIPRAAARGRAHRPPSCVGRLPPRSGRRRSRRPAAAPHGASLAECTGTMRTALGLPVVHRAAERAGEYIVTRSRQTRSLSSSAPRRPGAAVLVLAPARRSLAPGAALGCQRPSGAWPPPPHAGRRQGRPRRACVRRAGPAGRSVHCIP